MWILVNSSPDDRRQGTSGTLVAEKSVKSYCKQRVIQNVDRAQAKICYVKIFEIF